MTSPGDLHAARAFLAGIAETTEEEARSLRDAGAVRLGRKRVARIQVLIGKAASIERLAKRPLTVGDPFRL